MAGSGGSGQGWWTRWGWTLPALAIAVVGIAAQFGYPPNDDATWLMEVARHLRDGATLYSADIVEINPPLIFWLTDFAVRLAAWLHLDPVTLWRLFVGAQALLSLGVIAATLAAADGDDDDRPLLLACSAALLTCLPGYHFGQREHLILLWFMPYLWASAAWVAGAPQPLLARVSAGVPLALGLALKPHYLFAVLLVEAGILLHRRSPWTLVRPVLLSALLVAAAYAGLVAVCCPSFFSFALPLALDYYPAYTTFQVQPIHVAYVVAAVAAILVTARPSFAWMLCWTFALAGVGAYGAYYLQHQGWPYHFLPAKTFALLSIAVAGAATWRRVLRWLAPRVRPMASAGALATLVVVVAALTIQQAQSFQETRQARVVRNVEAFLENVDFGPGPRRFAALSLTLFPAFPVNELLHARWSSRFSCLWILPGIVAEEASGAPKSTIDGKPARAYLEGAMSEDFERWQPRVVLVEDSRNMSVLEQLLRSARFRAIWSRYRPIGRVEYFEVFIRDDAPAGSAPAALKDIDAHGGERVAPLPAAPGRLQGGP